MLTVEGIVSAISTIGFPIVCCLVLGWYVKYITDKNREEINKLNEQHKAEMADVTQAINNNTLVMQQLIDSLNKNESEVTSE